MTDIDTAVLRAKYGDLGGQVCPLCESWRSCGCESAAEDVLALCDEVERLTGLLRFTEQEYNRDVTKAENDLRAAQARADDLAAERDAMKNYADDLSRTLVQVTNMVQAAEARATAAEAERDSLSTRYGYEIDAHKSALADLSAARAQVAAVRALAGREAQYGYDHVTIESLLAALTAAEGGARE